MKTKLYNRTNFHQHTFCVFKEVDCKSIEGLNSNYTSKSGSVYFFTDEGVYRQSNHWGRAANCKWRLESNTIKSASRNKIGFALWTDFHSNNDFEKLYFIRVNFQDKSANYFHKNYSLDNENTVLRTASETTKTLKIIRNLFENDAWAKHFQNTNPEELRVKIINKLITTNETLQQIKSELF